MKILRFAFGVIGAICMIAVLVGYTHSVWVALVAAIGLAVLCPPDKDFKTPNVPMVGPRTHDVEEEGEA